MEIDLGGVRTWYTVDGDGEPLVYLHGGFSDASELDPVRDAYIAHFRVFAPERRGHGHSPDTPGGFDFALLAADTVAFLEQVVGGAAHRALDLVRAVAGRAEDAAEQRARRAQEAAGEAELVGLERGQEAVAAALAVELELETLVGGEILVVLRELDDGHPGASWADLSGSNAARGRCGGGASSPSTPGSR